MTLDATIRPAGVGDLDRLRGWLQASGLPIDDLTPGHMADFLVIGDDDGVVGMIGLEPYGDVGLLRSLVVDPAARGAGIGQRLVDALEAMARDRGIAELWLLTIDADTWFSRLDYVVRERDDAPADIRNTREFSGLCPGDAVLMSKRI